MSGVDERKWVNGTVLRDLAELLQKLDEHGGAHIANGEVTIWASTDDDEGAAIPITLAVVWDPDVEQHMVGLIDTRDAARAATA